MRARDVMTSTRFLALLVACLWGAGCSSIWNTPALGPVGPAPGGPSAGAPGGYLKVYTATVQHEIGDNTYYYPHRNYFIYDATGTVLLKRVSNHIGDMDETPALVSLLAGKYQVLADDQGYGRIKIPVVIRPMQVTTLHLDGAWEPPARASASEVVQLPNGEYIGWSALAATRAQASNSDAH